MDVEREYRTRIEAMSALERVRRAEALFAWSRGLLVRTILRERGPLSDRQLAHELAMRQYGTVPATRRWLEEIGIRAGG